MYRDAFHWTKAWFISHCAASFCQTWWNWDSSALQLRLQSISEQPRQLLFVTQDPKEMSIFHPSRMENCKLDFDTRDKFTVAVVASKIVLLLFTALREAAKWTNHKLHIRHLRSTWTSRMSSCEVRRWPYWCHLWTQCVSSRFDWGLHNILAWLQLPRRDQHPSSCLICRSRAGPHLRDTTHISCNYRPSLLRKIHLLLISSSSSSLFLWELIRQTPPTCREMNAESGNYQCTNGHWKIILTQRFTHTLTQTRECRAVLPVVE